MDLQQLWDRRDNLIRRLLKMEAQHEKTKRALAEAEAQLRKLDSSYKDNGGPSKVHVEPPSKLSAQLRTLSLDTRP